MLRLDRVTCGYDGVPVVRDFSLTLAAGQTLALLGRNGAGKTTLLHAIMGLVRISGGTVHMDGTEITRLPAHRIPGHGIALAPQGRRLFSDLSVAENLRVARLAARKAGGEAAAEPAIDPLRLFPPLAALLHRRAGTLSGGEQQMLAVARALCLNPRLLLLDEPAEGLMPRMAEAVLAAVAALKARGVAIILAEQKTAVALDLADRVMFLENGRARLETTPPALRADPQPLRRYLGLGG